MTVETAVDNGDPARQRIGWRYVLKLLAGDRFAVVSLLYLIALIAGAAIGAELFGEEATRMNLKMRNFPPFSMEHGWLYAFGADSLGRPILPRLLAAAQKTLLLAVSAVICSMVIGAVLGMVSGYFGKVWGNIIMRAADVIMSFPMLLLAVIVLYVLEPRVTNVIIVLTIARIPVYIRVARAEVLEVRERLFVESARAAGATNLRILLLHILPVVAPTVFTVATLDFANVMLAESGLSFLGIGVQPPGVTWGLMVAAGRNYLTNAWWLAFWPGLAIVLTALSANLLSNWLRIAMDPALRWRLERTRKDASDGRSDEK